MKNKKDLYSKILHWAYDKQFEGFTEKELFTECNLNSQDLIDSYVRIFRGGNTDNECLIGYLKNRDGIDYWHLTPIGISAFINYQTFEESKTEMVIKKEKEEIVKLSPEFYGVGINLKLLWSRVKNYFKIKK